MTINKEECIEIEKEVVKYSKEHQDEVVLKNFTSHVEEKLKNFKPTIMVYGTYNAGKSTLINALFGKEELAKTGDAPETSTISSYEYNGYTIYDTPGINAPQEHEDVTNEHLKKCELILFVLSNDGSFEERYIYERISEIVELKKPILIVVNNKTGIEKDSIQETQQFDKININLSKIGDAKGIDSIETKVDICMVNAKTALKAKLENKKILLSKSNILQLENTIDRLLKKSGNREVVNALNIFISDYINNTLSVIDSKIDNPEMKKTQETITYLEKLKQKTAIELQNIIQENTSIVVQNLLSLFLQKNQSGITAYIDKTTLDIQEQIQEKMQVVSDSISSKVDTFNKDFNEINISPSSTNYSLENDGLKTSSYEESNNKTTSLIGAAVAVNVIPPMIPIGPISIPARLIAQLALALYSAFSGSDEAKIQAQAEIDAKREQYLAAKNRADSFGFDYKNKLLTSVNTALNNLFDSTLKELVEFSKKLENNNNKLIEDKKELKNILIKLHN